VKGLGRQAHALQADFTQRGSVEALAEAAEAHWGRVDILVNNAGLIEQARDVRTQGGGFEHHMDAWDRVFDVNLRAPYELTWRIGNAMLARGSGAVVNVASVAGMTAMTDVPLYSMTKAALLHFTRQAALRYAPQVRVNAVAPGWTETGFNRGLLLTPEFQKAISRHVPLHRMASPEEIAEAILFLVTGATYVTGTTLTVDGGLVAEMR
jgi:3-oxoacyl-[acyl-carrier protein] reductase